ncbi:MAG: hypothetical protein J6Y77_01300 [Paludibacteraceae bacterium]|nr:hypothetical protein [Paludibacteraceae bacterium]
MRKNLCLLIGWCMGMGVALAHPTCIEGRATDYAGRKLQLSTITDGLSEQRRLLASDTVASDGRFRLEFELSETRMLCLDLGHYEGRLYAEPGKHYEIALPERQDLTEAERFNPYFRPKLILLSLIDPPADDLNLLIDRFDETADSVWEDCLFGGGRPELIEAGVNRLEEEFPADEHSFFGRYKRYNYAMLVNLYR